MARQEEVHARSLADPAGFWAEAAEGVEWFRRWDRVRDDTDAPLVRWFAGGVTNTCHNALDRHVAAGRGEQSALVYDSAMTGVVRAFSSRELRDEVARFAGGLAGLGVGRGDRVLLYMPMVPEAVVAMLACARLGAVHSVVFGGFAARELATRIDDAQPKVVLTASCGLEPGRVVAYGPLLDAAIDLASSTPARVVVLQRPELARPLRGGRDLDWREFAASADPVDCVPVAATDPLSVLHTSGTTGKPKGIVRDHGGHAVALTWSLRHVYGMQPGETFWAFSGFYATGDGGFVDADGDLWVMGRTDDVINVAGYRLSTGAIEEVLSRHPDVAECAVIGVADAWKGQVPLGLVVPKRDASGSADALNAELVARVRDEIGPVAAFKRALVVERLPKTRSGKILRGTLRRIADAESWTAPPTLDDPAALTEVRDVLRRAGFGAATETDTGATQPAGDPERGDR